MAGAGFRRVAHCGIAAAMALAAWPALADGLQAGQWRLLTTPEINGAVAPERQTMKCLTASDVANLEKTFSPVAQTTNSTCSPLQSELTPQRLTWRLQCTGQLDMELTGDYQFPTPDRYSAVVTAKSSMLGRLMQSIRTAIEAQRIGECQ